MKRIAEPIETTELCSYGCGQVAKFKNGSGNLMCCDRHNKCPANRKRNSSGVKTAHSEGRIPGWNNIPNLNRGWREGLTKDTDARIAKATSSVKEGYASGRLKPHRTPHSEETKQKLSILMSERLRDPEKRKNYGRGKRSWMELCFDKWLTDNNISGWQTEIHFWNSEARKNYFVDYLFEGDKLIIELDGNQHRLTEEHDKMRDLFLTSLGYKVIRISHLDFKSRYFKNLGFNDILGR